ncbi:Hypothetical protein ORPV_328 [Orpheovirus IHUMI-LCC2]|uniref:Uncharacterized protein n=1 Tax=Orpheovirus IHUMI-LCC2 TaxID=2023057 RepID=A0A2I2L3V7_9VIRU|nr:Hypothetical protein ORPV_328 [Orpheovirus IHUMI-LCC2]SNW62232.1 Hypothetical protein ORPV_328 [Orpheovirus IHUMI-LCC2]
MEIIYLENIGDKIQYLTRTLPSYKILGEDIPYWDEGGCGLFAQAILPIIKQNLDENAEIYTMRREGMKDIDHFLIYCPTYNKYLDSNGWDWYKDEYGKVIIKPWNGEINDNIVMCDIDKIIKLRQFINKYINIPFVIVNDGDVIKLWTRIDNIWYVDDVKYYKDIPNNVINYINNNTSVYIEFFM